MGRNDRHILSLEVAGTHVALVARGVDRILVLGGHDCARLHGLADTSGVHGGVLLLLLLLLLLDLVGGLHPVMVHGNTRLGDHGVLHHASARVVGSEVDAGVHGHPAMARLHHPSRHPHTGAHLLPSVHGHVLVHGEGLLRVAGHHAGAVTCMHHGPRAQLHHGLLGHHVALVGHVHPRHLALHMRICRYHRMTEPWLPAQVVYRLLLLLLLHRVHLRVDCRGRGPHV